ncbi:MAG: YdbL family protein [Gammaproteobacteria bacterium]|nr:YdbL family protein [Gammaproteobacteria bacterium]
MAIRTKFRTVGRILGPILILALLSPGLFAADLDQAKQRGMVCELPNGFLRAANSAPADVTTMVKNINEKRKQEYARIASEHGVTPEDVGKLTAQKLSPKCQ